MLRTILALVLLAASMQAQTLSTRPQPSPTASTPVPSSSVSGSDAVISIKGFCGVDPKPQDSSAPAADCVTVVTREQFEKITGALNTTGQPISPETQRKLAQSYVDLMLFAAAAHKDGVENNPKFATVLDLMRLRAMVDLYNRDLLQKYRNPSQMEIEAFYQQNQGFYETLKLRKITIPKTTLPSDDQAAYTEKATHIAQDIRERLSKGEDPAALQKEAYATLALAAPPPNTDAVILRPSQVPAASSDVVSLGIGGVSKVEAESTSYVIYKLESKQPLPLDQVKNDVVGRLVQQKMDTWIKDTQSAAHITFNDQYFAPANGPVLENLK